MQLNALPEMTDAEYLRNYRRLMGLRQEDVAKGLQIARTTVISIEQGKRRLLTREIQKLRIMGFPECKLVADPLAFSKTEPVQWELINARELELLESIRNGDLQAAIITLGNMIKQEDQLQATDRELVDFG